LPSKLICQKNASKLFQIVRERERERGVTTTGGKSIWLAHLIRFAKRKIKKKVSIENMNLHFLFSDDEEMILASNQSKNAPQIES
jgi:ethanolamine utilization microcompartment shell protein EutS